MTSTPSSSRPSVIWKLVLASLLVALGSGCMPDWTAGPAGAPRVAATGDSILRQLEFYGPTHPRSDRALTRSIQDAGWRASVRGENGWRIAWIHDLAGDAAARGADGIIVEGGVNDVAWIRQQPRPRVARAHVVAEIRDTLADLGGVDCVVWPTIPGGANFFYPADQVDRRSVRAINSELRRQATLRPNLTVPEWGSTFDVHRRYAGPDGLHLSAAGEAALQTVLLGAMTACGPGSPPQDVPTPTTAPIPTTVPPTTVPPTTTVPTSS